MIFSGKFEPELKQAGTDSPSSRKDTETQTLTQIFSRPKYLRYEGNKSLWRKGMNIWLQIALKLQEVSELLDTAESVQTKEWHVRQRYKQRLLSMKEQAIRNSLKD